MDREHKNSETDRPTRRLPGGKIAIHKAKETDELVSKLKHLRLRAAIPIPGSEDLAREISRGLRIQYQPILKKPGRHSVERLKRLRPARNVYRIRRRMRGGLVICGPDDDQMLISAAEQLYSNGANNVVGVVKTC